MKKIFTPIALLCGLMASAGPLTPAEALLRVNSDSNFRRVAARHGNAIECVATLPQLYVFSSGDGFFICPADDKAPALLGYADSGTFDLEGNPALQYWLATYAEQIVAAPAAQAAVERPAYTAIEPLLKTKWDQGSPYYDKCPMLGNNRCYTGCVATAMAQVAKYYNWPEKGTGTHSYTWMYTNETLSFDYGSTTFDWANMTNTYSSKSTAAEKEAVATLMAACGIGTNMMYTYWTSVASPMDMPGVLADNLGYGRDMQWAHRPYYSMLQWESIIYKELAAGRPVLYSGTPSGGGGHQFVCDGYDKDGFFHINWGWSGASDGYFRLNALEPGTLGIGGSAGGFNVGQEALLNLHPAKGGEQPVYAVGAQLGIGVSSAAPYAVGKPLEFYGPFLNTGAFALPKGTKLGLLFTNGTDEFTIEQTSDQDYAPNYGWSVIATQKFPDVKPGTYTGRAYFVAPESAERQPVQVAYGMVDEIYVTVDATGNLSFETPDVDQAEPVVTDLSYTGTKYYMGNTLKIKFTLSNASETADLASYFKPVLLYPETYRVAAAGDDLYASLLPGESATYSISRALYPDKELLAPGTYLLGIRAANGTIVGEPVEITVAYKASDVKTTVESFTVNAANPQAVEFEVEAVCDMGYFKDFYLVKIASGTEVVRTIETPVLDLPAPIQDFVTAIADLSDLPNGEYTATLRTSADKAISEAKAVTFTLKGNEDAISEVAADETNAAATYDLQGRRVVNPTRGLYIRSGRIIRLF